jgi:hypothetical protein
MTADQIARTIYSIVIGGLLGYHHGFAGVGWAALVTIATILISETFGSGRSNR